MIILQLIFWACVLGTFHSYVVFPFLLSILSRGRSLTIHEQAEAALPEVHIVYSVYNGERLVEEKMDSMLRSDYPADKLHIWVGSDHSTDRTNELLQAYADRSAQVHFRPFSERQGKGPVINALIAEVDTASGGSAVLLLTDASVMFDAHTVRNMVRHFNDPSVGLVGANIISGSPRQDGISYQEKAYFDREILMKYQEGLTWGASMGAFGACYAIRKELYHPVPKNFLVDDFYISMKVLEAGYRAIYDMEATSYIEVPNDTKTEFNRKVRISAGNFQNLHVFRHLLWPPFSGIAFAFLSHKVLRWYGPFFIILTFITAFLLMSGNYFFRLVFAAELLGLVSPLLNYVLGKLGMHIRLLRFVAHFYSMNLGMLIGYVRYKKGIRSNIWNPTQR